MRCHFIKEEYMKGYAGALGVILAIGCSTAVPVIAQDNHQEREQQNAERRNESAYYNNPYYKKGWNEGSHHKHKNYHWRNDADREAYSAGYTHGERGEQWQNPNAHRDHEHDHQ
jgi:hypothetical protein